MSRNLHQRLNFLHNIRTPAPEGTFSTSECRPPAPGTAKNAAHAWTAISQAFLRGRGLDHKGRRCRAALQDKGQDPPDRILPARPARDTRPALRHARYRASWQHGRRRPDKALECSGQGAGQIQKRRSCGLGTCPARDSRALTADWAGHRLAACKNWAVGACPRGRIYAVPTRGTSFQLLIACYGQIQPKYSSKPGFQSNVCCLLFSISISRLTKSPFHVSRRLFSVPMLSAYPEPPLVFLV